MVADDPNDQSATEAAFELLHAALALRLARGRTTVVDATNVERWARERLLAIARRYRRPAVAIVLDLPLEISLERNAARSDRRVPAAAVRRQQAAMRASVGGLEGEGFDPVWRFGSEDAVSGVTVERAVDKA
jgi:protein phosphatase